MEQVNQNQNQNQNQNSGSVIIGALVATVFISIVAVAMLKNTKAHSSMAISLSSAMNMNMATSSGVVATEWFFENNENGALGALDTFMQYEDASPKRKPYIFGGDGKKVRISGDQFFNSRLVDFNRADPNGIYSQFEISSGRSEGGRSLKSARAFYRVE